MKILVLGGGGREHALVWKLRQSPRVAHVWCAPGNAGIDELAEPVAIDVADIPAVVRFAVEQGVDLVVPGPELPLTLGVVDALQEAGIRAFGPSRAAAQLEGSKTFTKELMRRAKVPSGFFSSFTEADDALRYVHEVGAPIVVKADGLAAGKGVAVCETVAEAEKAIDEIMRWRSFGEAGDRLVVEEFLTGEEVSFMAITDGETVLPLASSQDHKRIGDGDTGPNTGGMGAYSPAPVVTPNVHARAMHEIILPTIAGMAKDGVPFTGFLYAGLMISPEGQVKTLEFNTRMGDPETQPILMRLKSDLVDVLMAATDGTLDKVELQWDRRFALGVVMAAAGYPAEPRKGDVISGLPADAAGTDDCMVFHAGTQQQGGQVLTSGGRVLCVTALGDSAKTAQQRAYEALQPIRFDGAQWRTDIGHRAIVKR